MNALGNSLFHDVVNQTYKKNNSNQYYADKPFRGCSKRQYSRWKIKNNMHIHCPIAAGSGLGCSWVSTTLSRFILLWSCKQTESPVAREEGGGRVPWVEGGRSLFIMGQAGLHWLLFHSILNTSAHLTDRLGLLTTDSSSVGHSWCC